MGGDPSRSCVWQARVTVPTLWTAARSVGREAGAGTSTKDRPECAVLGREHHPPGAGVEAAEELWPGRREDPSREPGSVGPWPACFPRGLPPTVWLADLGSVLGPPHPPCGADPSRCAMGSLRAGVKFQGQVWRQVLERYPWVPCGWRRGSGSVRLRALLFHRCW